MNNASKDRAKCTFVPHREIEIFLDFEQPIGKIIGKDDDVTDVQCLQMIVSRFHIGESRLIYPSPFT